MTRNSQRGKGRNRHLKNELVMEDTNSENSYEDMPELVPNFLRVDDIEHLAKALTLEHCDAGFMFSQGRQLSDNEFCIRRIEIKQLGAIQFPILKKDFDRLQMNSKQSLHGMGMNSSFNPSLLQERYIECSDVLFPNSDLVELKLMILKNISMPLELSSNTSLRLEKIGLYDSGCFYNDFYQLNCTDLIARVILQVPVEGGHQGGNLTVKYDGRVSTYDTSEISHQTFYLTMFYNGCRCSMEPITSGSQVTLVYNLLWSNFERESPQNFPAFISTYLKVKDILSQWISLQEDLQECDNLKEDSDEKSTVSKVKQGLLNSMSLSAKESVTDQMLYWILEETYSLDEISFQRLRGKDQHLAFLLQISSLVDLHLTTVIHEVEVSRTKDKECPICDTSDSDCAGCEGLDKMIRNENTSFKTIRWIDSHDIDVYFDMEVDWNSKNIGPTIESCSQNKPERIVDISKTLTPDGRFLIVKRYRYQHHVLVLWPKPLTFQMHCNYGIHSLVNRWEDSLTKPSLAQSPDLVRQGIRQGITDLVTLLSDHKLRRWSKRIMAGGTLMTKLFRLCIDMKAKKEGCDLLWLLGVEYGVSSQDLDFEGIANEEVAEVIAEFENRVGGWKNCVLYVQCLVTPERVNRQYLQMIHLAKCFLNFNCIRGVKIIANAVTSNFEFISRVQYLNPVERIDPIMDFVGLLELDPRTSCETRRNTFVTHYFANISPSEQIQLLKDAEAKRGLLLDIPSSQLLFESMARSLSEYLTKDYCLLSDCVIRILKFFVRYDNEWLSSFITNLCRIPSEETSQASFNDMIDKLVRTDDLMTLVSISTALNSAFCTLVPHRVELLTAMLLTVDYASRNSPVVLLSSYLKFFKELIQSGFRPNEMDQIAKSLAILNFNKLLCLVVDVIKFNGANLNGTIQSVEYLGVLLKILFLSMANDSDTISFAEVNLDALLSITSLGSSYIVSFIKRVGQIKIQPSNWRDQHQLFKLVLVDIWPRLHASKKSELFCVCANHLNKLIIFMNHQIPAGEIPNDIAKMSSACLLFSARLESLGLGAFPEHWGHFSTCFSNLLHVSKKFPVSMLQETISNVYQLKSDLITKQLLSFMKTLIEMCRLYLKGDVVLVADVLRWLLWIDDDQCWQLFADGICNSLAAGKIPPLADLFEKHVDIQQSFLLSPFGLNSLDRIVDAAEKRWKSLGENWKQPKATVNGYPEIEAFLRGDQRSMVYRSECHMRGIKAARIFAVELLKRAPNDGFSVEVIAVGHGPRASCQITKLPMKQDGPVDESLQLHLSELKKIIETRKKAVMGSQSQPVDSQLKQEHVPAPSPKRPKLDENSV